MMIKQGTVLIYPPGNDRLEFLETSESSGGKHLKVKWHMKPGGIKPASHIHLLQDESFEVLSGELTYELGGKTGVIGASQNLTLPKEVAHTHYNNSTQNVEMIQTLSPALDSQEIFYRIYRLSEEGKISRGGNPPLLEAMIWVNRYKAKTYLAKMPVGLQNFLSRILAPIGELLGHGK